MARRGEQEALQRAAAVVGDRWVLLLVHALLDGPQRFNDLQQAVPGIAPNILSQRLKQLEQERLVVPSAYSQRPLRFTYELTAAGRELAGALRLLAQWGARDDELGVRHELCGSPLEATWWCPTCDRVVEDADAAEHRFL